MSKSESKRAAKTYRFARERALSQLMYPCDDEATDWLEAADVEFGTSSKEVSTIVDASTTTVTRLMFDRRMLAAYKNFCKGVIDAVKYVEREKNDSKT